MQTVRKRNRWSAARERRREAGRRGGIRSQQVQAESRLARAPDADTVHRRALEDARGKVERQGDTYTATHGVVPWCIRRAVYGRTDQVELVVAGLIRERGGRRDIRDWLGKSQW